MEPNDRVAVVTGVTGKVGRGIAVTLAQQGMRVVGTGRRRERGEAFEAQMRAQGLEAMFVHADVSRVDDCDATIAAAVERYGRVDVLVNNAATVGDPPFVSSHDASEQWWDDIFDTNVKGAFFCCRAALPHMVAQRSGIILNIGSAVAIHVGPPRMAPYTASKAALIAVSKTLALEYAEHGVRVNTVVVGGAEGDNQYKVQDARAGATDPAPYDERDTGMMTGEELGRVIAFLCSDDARYINGASIPVDRGYSAGVQRTTPTPIPHDGGRQLA